MKKILVAGCALAAALAIGLIAYFSLNAANDPASGKPVADDVRNDAANSGEIASPSKNNLRTKSSAAKNGMSGKRKLQHQKIAYADRNDLYESEKCQLEAIEDALEKENLSALAKLLPDIYGSTNAEIRSEMVDALGWFGEQAMAELLPFMADRDSEIAQAAIDNWTTALADVSDGREKAKLIERAMQIIRDKDSLESMIMELGDCDDVAAMQTIVNLIASENANASSVAREHYEFVTGEEYTDFAAAEKWVRENCTDDESMPDGEGDSSADEE